VQQSLYCVAHWVSYCGNFLACQWTHHAAGTALIDMQPVCKATRFWHLHGYYEVTTPYTFHRPNKQISLAIVAVQVIPAGSTAKFPVVFSDSRVQHFQQTVEYVVNGCHIFTFQVLQSPFRSALSLSCAVALIFKCTVHVGVLEFLHPTALRTGLLHCNMHEVCARHTERRPIAWLNNSHSAQMVKPCHIQLNDGTTVIASSIFVPVSTCSMMWSCPSFCTD